MKVLIKSAVFLLAAIVMSAAVVAFQPAPPRPTVRAVWLPEMPVLGPAAYQDPGHRLRQQDPQSYCWNPATSGSQVRQRERDPHAHRCLCHLVCQYGAGGEPNGEHEDATCAHYCVREACDCHVEEACETPEAP